MRDTQNLLCAWRWWLPPAALALALALLFIDPFIGDWDALDYTVLALHGAPSSMALGRTLFIFANHALWLVAHALFNLQAADAYLLFKYAVVAQSPFAVIACWTLARDVTRSLPSATIAALLVAVSPAFVIYSGQVMTEIPSLLLLAVALTIYLRGVRLRRVWLMLAGAALLGAGANVRETVAFYGLWLVVAPLACGWKLERREIALVALACFVFFIFAIGGWAFWFMPDIGNYRASWYGWRESMRMETARHPVALRNALPFLFYFILASPLISLALPFAVFREWRVRQQQRQRGDGFLLPLALAFTGLAADLLLLLNYSTAINWRYLLTGVPAFAPLVANQLLRRQTSLMWNRQACNARPQDAQQQVAAQPANGMLQNQQRAFFIISTFIVLVTLTLALVLKPQSRRFVEKHAQTKDYRARLALLPRDAVVMAGGQTIAVTYWRGVGSGEWDAIGTGGGWPGAQLESDIENFLHDGRRVFLDVDARWWAACGWQKEETIELIGLESKFRFRRVAETIYEVRPLTDSSANDDANLRALLPEHRPEDMRRCSVQGKVF
jgi:4-amino-4-deoxy-L-arabinose transferase-like glycosyltransferase